MRRAARLDRQRGGLQALAEDLPAEQRAIVVDLVDPAAEQIGVELLQLEHFVQVLRGWRRQRCWRWSCGASLAKRFAAARPAYLAGARRPLTGAAAAPRPLRYSRRAIFATLRATKSARASGPFAEGACSADSANLIKGFFSLFISGVERRNPEALLELEQENLRKQIANFNQGLATHAGLCERIMGQVRKLEAEQKDLRAKTTAHLRAGNKSAAGQYALRLQTIDAQLEENRKQLEQAEGDLQEPGQGARRRGADRDARRSKA